MKLSETCKNALVNLILENCKRKKAGQELIHLFFVIDKNSSSYPFSAVNIASEKYDGLITNKELRRLYKLCNEVPNELISQVAKESCTFIKTKKTYLLLIIYLPNWKLFPPFGKTLIGRRLGLLDKKNVQFAKLKNFHGDVKWYNI